MSIPSPDFSFSDPHLSLPSTSPCSLSLRILSEGFAFCIRQISDGRIVLLENYRFNDSPSASSHIGSIQYIRFLNSILSGQTPFIYSFTKTQALLGDCPVTLVPAALFKPEDAEKFFSFNHSLNPGHKIEYDYITTPELVVLYGLPLAISDWLSANFPAITRKSISGALLQYSYVRYKAKKESEVCAVNLHHHSADVMLMLQGGIKFLNHFRFSTPHDLLYYLLFMTEQLKIDTDTITLWVTGRAENMDELTNLLSLYFGKCEFPEPTVPESLEQVSDIKSYYDLIYFGP